MTRSTRAINLPVSLTTLLAFSVFASNPAPGQTPALPAPDGVAAEVTAKGFRVTWRPVPGAQQYEWERANDLGAFAAADQRPMQSVPGDETAFDDTTPAPGLPHYYRVRAVAADGRRSPFGVASASDRPRFTIEGPLPEHNVQTAWPRVRWAHLPGARHYLVTAWRGTSADPQSPFVRDYPVPGPREGKWVEFDVRDVRPAGAGRPGRGTADRQPILLPGETYRFRIVAVTDQGPVPAVNNPAQAKTPTLLDAAGEGETGFRLRRTFEPADNQAAKISFNHTAGRDAKGQDIPDKYSFDFSLEYRPRWEDEWAGWDVSPVLNLEAKVASDKTKAQDALRARAGFEFQKPLEGVRLAGAEVTDAYFFSVVKYEADSDFDTQVLVLETRATAFAEELGLGRGWPPSENAETAPPVQAVWEPMLGFDVGRALERSEPRAPTDPVPGELEDEVLRLVATVYGRVVLNDLAKTARLREISLYADWSFYYLPLEEEDQNFDFLATGLEFYLTDSLALTFTYKVGESPPNFFKTEQFDIGLGVRF